MLAIYRHNIQHNLYMWAIWQLYIVVLNNEPQAVQCNTSLVSDTIKLEAVGWHFSEWTSQPPPKDTIRIALLVQVFISKQYHNNMKI